ncbi:MAG: TonB-dependent receptor [Bacteroidales bacterium]
MKRLLVLLTMGLGSITGITQPCMIQGKVTDAQTKEELIGATIFLMENETVGTMSNYDGTFALDVQPGTYTVVCTYITYEDQIIENITIDKGENITVNFNLSVAAVETDKVFITARANKESEIISLLDQKNAQTIQTSIGAQELSRKGASDVASGVKKMSGISMIGSKQLFVRGLGDRYNKALLNNMPVPSPDPTKKVIQLDLFPSDVVKNIGVHKVYSAEHSADYSGALINIETKDYPDKKFLTIGGGIGYNNQTTGRNFIEAYSETDNFFGFDVQQRNEILPEEYKIVNRNQNSKDASQDIFSTHFGDVQYNALPDISLDISGGNSYMLENGKAGILFSSSFSNDYLFEDYVYDAQLKADGTIKNKFYKDTYTYSTQFTNLLSASYISHKGGVIKANMFYTSGTEDVAELKYDGWDNEGDSLFIRNYSFSNNRLYYLQILGDKAITSSTSLSWDAGYSQAESSIPDRRQTTYIKQNNEWSLFALNQQETARFFTDQQESTLTGSFKGNYHPQDESYEISAGIESSYTMKDFNSYAYFYDISAVQNIVTEPYTPLDIFSEENFEENNIYVKNGNSYPMLYTGEKLLGAAFSSINYEPNEQTTINFGLRYEYADMTVTDYNQIGTATDISLISHDIFPALNITYKQTENKNIRLAASKTITRPGFYEKSPASVIPAYGEPKTEGNKNLKNGYNYNIDLKYEIFPTKREIISFGVYGKILQNPIEMISKPTGGTIMYTFKNTERGYAGGAEIEVKKVMQEQFFVGANAAYMYTLIRVSENANETEKTRAMQGASPFLINADAGYQFTYGENEKHTSSLALVYNVYGQRLYAVGSGGMGSIFEKPFHSLNLVIKNKLSKVWNIDLSIKNILYQEQTYVQGVNYNQDTKTYERFKTLKNFEKGISADINISYTIN